MHSLNIHKHICTSGSHIAWPLESPKSILNSEYHLAWMVKVREMISTKSFGCMMPPFLAFPMQHKWEQLQRSSKVPKIFVKWSDTEREECLDNRPTVFHRPSSWLCMDFVWGKQYFAGPWTQAEHQENPTCNNKEHRRRPHHPGP